MIEIPPVEHDVKEPHPKVMSEAKITVSITRRGKPLKLTYTIK